MGGQVDAIPDQEAVHGRIVCPRAPEIPPLKVLNALVKHTAVHSSLSLWCVSQSCSIDRQGNFEVIARAETFSTMPSFTSAIAMYPYS